MEEVAKNVYVIFGAEMCSNAYVLESGGEKLLIDAGDGTLSIDFRPKYVLLTHGHFDHTRGVKSSWLRVFLHENDLKAGSIVYAPPNAHAYDFKNLDFGNFELEVIHAPGHTLGSVVIYEKKNKILFSGDTLFAGGAVGRTDLGGDDNLLARTLENIQKIDYRLLCPGHGDVE